MNTKNLRLALIAGTNAGGRLELRLAHDEERQLTAIPGSYADTINVTLTCC